jgi:hypothetical protein
MIDDAQLVNTLLEQGILDQATLKEGLEQTEGSQRSLYETLILHRLVTEEKLVSLVSGILNVPAVHPDPAEIPSDVRDLVPASMARRNRVLPLRLHEQELVLGMVDPIDVLAMDEIATHTGIDIRPVLIGPSTIDEALEDLYGAAPQDSGEIADDVLASFDDFDVQGMMDEVMEDEEWDSLFDDEDDAPSVEDSAVLSRDMRDRPSTDVLAEEDVDAAVDEADAEAAADGEEKNDEDDLIEIEIIEELGKPVDIQQQASEYVSLDDWEVDEAIGGPGDAEILSAESAEALFKKTPSGKRAALEALEADDSTQRTTDSELISEALEDTQSSKTTIGVSVDHLEDGELGGEAREATGDDDEDDTGRTDTGRTELGVATRASSESPAKKGGSGTEGTDYGALGRAILKSSPSGSEGTDDETDVREESEPDDETQVREESEPDDETQVRESDAEESDAEESDAEESDAEESDAEESDAEESDAEERDAEETRVEEAGDDDPTPDDAAISLKEERDDRPTDPDFERPPAPKPDGVLTREIDAEALEALTGGEDEQAGDVPAIERPDAPAQTDIIDPVVVEEDRREAEGPGEPAPQAPQPEDTRPRLNSPQVRLPEGIDVEGLALALANLLIAKEILTLDEVFQLAQSLTPDE